jgi:hypothetical protein
MAVRTEDLPPPQRRSKLLLGSAYRLEIAAWIWEFGATPINPTQLTNGLRVRSEDPPSHSSVAQELEKLVSCGLLGPLKVPGRDVYYERRDSVFYEMCDRLRREVQGALDSVAAGPSEQPG